MATNQNNSRSSNSRSNNSGSARNSKPSRGKGGSSTRRGSSGKSPLKPGKGNAPRRGGSSRGPQRTSGGSSGGHHRGASEGNRTSGPRKPRRTSNYNAPRRGSEEQSRYSDQRDSNTSGRRRPNSATAGRRDQRSTQPPRPRGKYQSQDRNAGNKGNSRRNSSMSEAARFQSMHDESWAHAEKHKYDTPSYGNSRGRNNKSNRSHSRGRTGQSDNALSHHGRNYVPSESGQGGRKNSRTRRGNPETGSLRGRGGRSARTTTARGTRRNPRQSDDSRGPGPALRRANAKSSSGRFERTRFDKAAKGHRVRFAQNFIKNPALVRKIVRLSALTPDSRVLEIGPGKGVITAELAKVAQKVTAVEMDMVLYKELKERFRDQDNVALLHGDFLRRKDSLGGISIFSNPPFNVFSKIVQKVIWSDPFPDHVYLFGQREAANRFCGAGRDFVNHVLISPWLTPKVVYRFNRDDFVPAPRVDVVLLHITKRKRALLPRSQQQSYVDFVQFGYGNPRTSLDQVFKRVFTPKQWTRLSKDLGFEREVRARELTRDQWVELFKFYTSSVDPSKRRLG